MTDPTLVAIPTANPAPPTDPLSRHRVDLRAVEEGRWVEIEGDLWRIAKWGFKRNMAARAAAMQELGMNPDAECPPAHMDAVAAARFAGTILECKLKDGPGVKYTLALGRSIWIDPELADYRDMLWAEMHGDFTKASVARSAALGN